MNHIRDKLPDMKARLNTLMGQTQQELNAFGDSAFLGEQHRGSLILKLMTQFVRDFLASIDGTSLEISTKELCGGARIYYIFNDVFGLALESIDPIHNLTVQDIRTAIRNSTGPRPSLFVPEVAFDLLVKPQIKLLEPPSLRCVEMVYEELMKICHNCTSTVRLSWPLSEAHGLTLSVSSGAAAVPAPARAANRGRLGPTARAPGPDVRVRAVAHRDPGRLHQHEPPLVRVGLGRSGPGGVPPGARAATGSARGTSEGASHVPRCKSAALIKYSQSRWRLNLTAGQTPAQTTTPTSGAAAS